MITYITKQTKLLSSEIKVESSLDGCIEYCKSKKILGLDTETTGLSFVDDRLLLVQIGDKERQYVIDAQSIELKPLSIILEDSQITKVLHNAKFDYKFIKQNIRCRIDNVYDTMLAEALLSSGKRLSLGLKNLVLNYLKIDIDKEVRGEFINKSMSDFTLQQVKYSADDVFHLLPIREAQIKLIEEYNLKSVLNLENEAVLAFADMEFNGLKIDLPRWNKVAEDVKEEINEILEKLYDFILSNEEFKSFIPPTITLSLFDDEKTELRRQLKSNFNFSSPKQVLSLFKTLEPSLDSVNADVLQTIKNIHSIIGLYITFKEKEKLYNSYGPKFSKYIRSDGKVHTNFKQIVSTGRAASSSPNMHQIPATNTYRNSFVCDDSDWVFASSDFSSQELCIIATGSKDPVWIDALTSGQDLHSVCASLVFDKKWKNAAEEGCAYYIDKSVCTCAGHKKLRTHAKTVNFGLAYGMSAQKLSDTIGVSLQTAENIINKFFATFPKIRQFLNNLGKFGVNNGYVKTFPPFERIRWFEEWTPQLDDARIKSSIERQSKNTPIQGTGADMTKVALVLIRRLIILNDLPVKLVMTVHDQIDTIVHKDFAQRWKVLLQKMMEKAAERILENGLLKAETEISKCWKK